MAGQMKAALQSRVVVEVIYVAHQLSQGKDIGLYQEYRWLKAFDTEELNELVAEIMNAFRHGCDTDNWDTLDVVIHEWHESAIAIESPELAAAFSDEVDEVPLTLPSTESIMEKRAATSVRARKLT
jgi:hypothetical protein